MCLFCLVQIAKMGGGSAENEWFVGKNYLFPLFCLVGSEIKFTFAM